MELVLRREPSTERCTHGELFVNGKFECVTLEDPVRDHKIPGVTAIAAGRYEIVINWSMRFKRFLPLLLNVANFIGIRIHSGNRPEDTEGCILVGERKGKTDCTIVNSRIAFNRLFGKLYRASKKEKIWITVQ